MAKRKSEDEEYQNYLESGYSPSGLEYAGTVLGGAATGFAAGSAFGPVGMGVGAAAGLGVGIAQAASARDAAYDAWVRDQELEKQLSGVDNLADYMDATSVRQASAIQEAQLGSKQAAARSGATGVAQEALAQSATLDLEQARAAEIATALPAARQIDLAERQQIVGETYNRQELYSMAAQPPDYLGQFGRLAGAAAQFATVQQGGYAHPGEGQVASQDAVTAGASKAAGYLGATDEYGDPVGAQYRNPASVDEAYQAELPGGMSLYERQASQDAGTSDWSEGYVDYSSGKPDVKFGETVDQTGIDEEQAAFDQATAQMNMEQASRDATLMVMNGTVTESEMASIVMNSPDALTDPLALQAAVSNYNAVRYGPQTQPSYAPFGGTPAYGDVMGYGVQMPVDPSSMSPYQREQLARQMVR